MGYVDVLTDRFRGVFQGKDSDPSQFGLKTGWVGKNLAEQLSRRSVLKGFAGAAATATGCTEAQYLFSDYKYVELEEIMENGLEPYYDEDFGGEKLVTDGYVEEIGLVETYPDNGQEARELTEHCLYPGPDSGEGIRVFEGRPPLPSGDERQHITVRGEVGRFNLDESRDDPVYALMNRRASFND